MGRATAAIAVSVHPLRGLAILIGLVGGLATAAPAFADGEAAPAAAVPVSVATAKRADVPVTLAGIGSVQALNTVTVRTQVDGQLQQVLFSEGQTVKRGDLLAVVDPRLFQAAYDQAVAKTQQDRAALADAELILNRDIDLGAKDFTSVQTVDTQRSTVAQLKAQVAADEAAAASAETQLSYTRITSPIDGVTGFRLVDQGNIVHASDATGLVVVTQIQPISVVSTLPEEDFTAVRKALAAGPVEVTASDRAGGDRLDVGTLALIDNEIDPASGTIRLKSTFPNAGGTLWPGQFVDVALKAGVIRGALTVPSSAVERGPDGFFVYAVENGRAVVRPVKVGQIAHGVAVIEAGLDAGAVVVTDGQYRLVAGAPVSPGPPASDAPPAAAPSVAE